MAVLGLGHWHDMRFPERALGGWWWTWRWRFEILTRWNEYESVQWCRRLIRPGMTVVDIGAHIGYYTRLFSELVGPSGRVFAFEAHPENFAILKRNLCTGAYANVEALNLAVSDRSSKVQLHVSPGSSNHSLLKGYTEEVGVIEIDGIALDDFLSTRGIKSVDFIKSDVEGGEPLVLQGSKRVVVCSPQLAMLMEYNPMALRCGGAPPGEMIRLLKDGGFRVEAILPDASLVEDPTLVGDETVNLLCRRYSTLHNA